MEDQSNSSSFNNEYSLRKSCYHNKTAQEIFENKLFRCGHIECLSYLKDSMTNYEFLVLLRKNHNHTLRFASKHGHLEVVVNLLSMGLTSEDIRDKRNIRKSYLDVPTDSVCNAAKNGHLEIVELFYSSGISRGDYYHEFFQSVLKNQARVIKFLSKFSTCAEVEVMLYLILNDKPLKFVDLDMVKLLLDIGSDKDPAWGKEYVLRWSTENNCDELIAYLS